MTFHIVWRTIQECGRIEVDTVNWCRVFADAKNENPVHQLVNQVTSLVAKRGLAFLKKQILLSKHQPLLYYLHIFSEKTLYLGK